MTSRSSKAKGEQRGTRHVARAIVRQPVIIEADRHERYSRQRRKDPDVPLIFEQIRAGGDRNFGYLLGDRDTRQGVLIDPSYSPEAFVQRARDQGLTVTHVINTHGHPDHTNGNAKAESENGPYVDSGGL